MLSIKYIIISKVKVSDTKHQCLCEILYNNRLMNIKTSIHIYSYQKSLYIFIVKCVLFYLFMGLYLFGILIFILICKARQLTDVVMASSPFDVG